MYLEHSYRVSDGESFFSAVYKSFNFVASSRIWNCVMHCMYLLYVHVWTRRVFKKFVAWHS